MDSHHLERHEDDLLVHTWLVHALAASSVIDLMLTTLVTPEDAASVIRWLSIPSATAHSNPLVKQGCSFILKAEQEKL